MRAVGFGSARSYLASRSIVVFAVFLTYLVRAIIQKLLGNVIGLKTEKPKTAEISGATTMAGAPEKRGMKRQRPAHVSAKNSSAEVCQERRDLRREGGVSPVFPVPYLRAISS